MACFLINRSPWTTLDGKVAEEVCTGNEVDYSGLRVFGCPAYLHISGDERSKLDPMSKQGRVQALGSSCKEGGD